MKSKRRWLLLLSVLALFVWAYQAASWRPKLVGVQPTQSVNGPGLLPSTFSGPQLLISPDGNYLASVATLRTGYVLTLWNPQARQQLWRHGDNATRQFPFAFSPNSQTLAVIEDKSVFGRPSAVISLVESATGKSRALRQSFWQTDLQCVAFLSNRELVAATTQGASVVDTQTGKTIQQWNFDLPMLTTIKSPDANQSHVSADGTTVIALTNGTSESAIAVYDARTGKKRGVWTYPKVFRNPRLSPDGTLWAMNAENEDVPAFYEAQTGQRLWSPNFIISARAPWVWSADSKRVACSFNSDTGFFDARSGRYLMKINAIGQAIALDPHSDYFYTLDSQGKMWRWRAR